MNRARILTIVMAALLLGHVAWSPASEVLFVPFSATSARLAGAGA